METLYKTVRQDGGGDYTDFVTAVSSILASGLAATGQYDSYVLSVDSGVYSGYFIANVPFSGSLSIIGSGTWWYPQGASVISGISPLGSLSNVELSNFSIVGTSPLHIFDIYSGASMKLYDTELINITNGILNSGTVTIENVSSQGLGVVSGGCFLEDYGRSLIDNSRIAYFVSGIYTSDCMITNSIFNDNNQHIISNNSGLISVSNIAINGGGSGIVFNNPSGELYISSSSIKSHCPININDINLYVNTSILYGSTYCITGSVLTGVLSDVCMYPSGTLISLTQNNVKIADPQFKDSANSDLRLVFKQTTGSPCVEVKDQEILSSSVDLYTEQAQFDIKDSRGTPATYTFTDFIYKQGNTLLLSDYMKEIKFAKAVENFSNLNYRVEMIANFEVSGVSVRGAFNRIDAPFPYDWNYKTFNTTEITNRHKYIIPRSVVDVVEAITDYVGPYIPRVVFNKIDKRHITPYLYADYRGVAFDYDLSVPGKAVVWMIEGNNQTLVQLNAYTGERLAEYPLFVPSMYGEAYVRPSGIIKVGVEKDEFKYVLESDPNYELLSKNDNGRFDWISTELDTHKDARGLLAYKGNLYMTVTEYNPQSILDRDSIPMYSGSVGKLVRYNNNDTFEHYIANYTTQAGPSGFLLGSGNSYPTDITVYEDGSLLVADWAQRDSLFRYKLAYDYALVQSSYDTETRVLLREYYDNVEL